MLKGHAQVEPLDMSISLLWLYWSVLLLLICKTKKESWMSMSITRSEIRKPAKHNNIIVKSFITCKSEESLCKFHQWFCGDWIFFVCLLRCDSYWIEVTKEFLVESSSPLISCSHCIQYTALDTGCSKESLFNKSVNYNATCTGCSGKATVHAQQWNVPIF